MFRNSLDFIGRYRRNGMPDACGLVSQFGSRGEQGLVHDPTALHDKQLPRHKIAIRAGQEEGGAGNIFG